MVLKIPDGPINSIGSVSNTEYNTYQINSIEWRYKAQRQLSKAPTFALT